MIPSKPGSNVADIYRPGSNCQRPPRKTKAGSPRRALARSDSQRPGDQTYFAWLQSQIQRPSSQVYPGRGRGRSRACAGNGGRSGLFERAALPCASASDTIPSPGIPRSPSAAANTSAYFRTYFRMSMSSFPCMTEGALMHPSPTWLPCRNRCTHHRVLYRQSGM